MLPEIKLLIIDYSNVAPHIYVIRILNGQRNNLMRFLKEKDIETGVPYIPNHLHSFYKNEDIRHPETEKAFEEILAMPLHVELTEDDLGTVITRIKEFFKEKF